MYRSGWTRIKRLTFFLAVYCVVVGVHAGEPSDQPASVGGDKKRIFLIDRTYSMAVNHVDRGDGGRQTRWDALIEEFSKYRQEEDALGLSPAEEEIYVFGRDVDPEPVTFAIRDGKYGFWKGNTKIEPRHDDPNAHGTNLTAAALFLIKRLEIDPTIDGRILTDGEHLNQRYPLSMIDDYIRDKTFHPIQVWWFGNLKDGKPPIEASDFASGAKSILFHVINVMIGNGETGYRTNFPDPAREVPPPEPPVRAGPSLSLVGEPVFYLHRNRAPRPGQFVKTNSDFMGLHARTNADLLRGQELRLGVSGDIVNGPQIQVNFESVTPDGELTRIHSGTIEDDGTWRLSGNDIPVNNLAVSLTLSSQVAYHAGEHAISIRLEEKTDVLEADRKLTVSNDEIRLIMLESVIREQGFHEDPKRWECVVVSDEGVTKDGVNGGIPEWIEVVVAESPANLPLVLKRGQKNGHTARHGEIADGIRLRFQAEDAEERIIHELTIDEEPLAAGKYPVTLEFRGQSFHQGEAYGLWRETVEWVIAEPDVAIKFTPESRQAGPFPQQTALGSVGQINIVSGNEQVRTAKTVVLTLPEGEDRFGLRLPGEHQASRQVSVVPNQPVTVSLMALQELPRGEYVVPVAVASDLKVASGGDEDEAGIYPFTVIVGGQSGVEWIPSDGYRNALERWDEEKETGGLPGNEDAGILGLFRWRHDKATEAGAFEYTMSILSDSVGPDGPVSGLSVGGDAPAPRITLNTRDGRQQDVTVYGGQVGGNSGKLTVLLEKAPTTYPEDDQREWVLNLPVSAVRLGMDPLEEAKSPEIANIIDSAYIGHPEPLPNGWYLLAEGPGDAVDVIFEAKIKEGAARNKLYLEYDDKLFAFDDDDRVSVSLTTGESNFVNLAIVMLEEMEYQRNKPAVAGTVSFKEAHSPEAGVILTTSIPGMTFEVQNAFAPRLELVSSDRRGLYLGELAPGQITPSPTLAICRWQPVMTHIDIEAIGVLARSLGFGHIEVKLEGALRDVCVYPESARDLLPDAQTEWPARKEKARELLMEALVLKGTTSLPDDLRLYIEARMPEAGNQSREIGGAMEIIGYPDYRDDEDLGDPIILVRIQYRASLSSAIITLTILIVLGLITMGLILYWQRHSISKMFGR